VCRYCGRDQPQPADHAEVTTHGSAPGAEGSPPSEVRNPSASPESLAPIESTGSSPVRRLSSGLGARSFVFLALVGLGTLSVGLYWLQGPSSTPVPASNPPSTPANLPAVVPPKPSGPTGLGAGDCGVGPTGIRPCGTAEELKKAGWTEEVLRSTVAECASSLGPSMAQELRLDSKFRVGGAPLACSCLVARATKVFPRFSDYRAATRAYMNNDLGNGKYARLDSVFRRCVSWAAGEAVVEPP
jgi:hypothetical protein